MKIAIQKSGRLHDDSLTLLREAGLAVDNGFDQLIAPARDYPADVLFLRNSDIPQYVVDGVADMAIIGENVLVEKGKGVKILQRLGFSRCRLSIAVPRETVYDSPKWLDGKKIATSYPNTLRDYLERNGLSADIHEISGSVEIAPGIGLADAICDLVSSGSTLFRNGLKEVEVILKSESCLVSGPSLTPEKERMAGELLFRIRSVLEGRENRYVLLNAPNNKLDTICSILPGMKSPTIMPLAIEGWSSVHSVINHRSFWEIIEKLKEAGAEGILVIPIEKMARGINED